MTSLHTSMRIIEQSRDPVVGSVDVFIERLRAGKSIAMPRRTAEEKRSAAEWLEREMERKVARTLAAKCAGRARIHQKKTDAVTCRNVQRLRKLDFTFTRIGELLGIGRAAAQRAVRSFDG